MGHASEPVIYHLTTRYDWEAQRHGEMFTAASLRAEGFIHCSTAGQVVGTANMLFHGRTDLVVLCIEPSRVQAEVRYENLEGGTTLFPHVYGPLPIGAVRTVHPFPPEADGRFVRTRFLTPEGA